MATYWADDETWVVSSNGGSTYMSLVVRSYGASGTIRVYRNGTLVNTSSIAVDGGAVIGDLGTLSTYTEYEWTVSLNGSSVVFCSLGGNDTTCSGGGGGTETEGCILYDSMSLTSSSYSNGVVNVSFRIYFYNDGDTYDDATIYYQIGNNGHYNQTVYLYGGDDDYITCNMYINTGTLTTTSYTFNVNGYIDSSNCGNDHFSKNLTATWADEPEEERPSKFYWISSSSNLTKGSAVSTYITASKWKALQNNVNAVRAYKGLSSYSFTTVSSGMTIKATYYNQLVYAINAMLSTSSTYYLYTVSAGDTITASLMNKLQNAINSVS